MFFYVRLFAQFGIGRAFVADAFEIVAYAELFDAHAHRRCVAAGNHGGLHAAGLQHFQPVAVQGVERFDFFPVVADEDAAVGQYAVDIENQQLDLRRTGLQVGG